MTNHSLVTSLRDRLVLATGAQVDVEDFGSTFFLEARRGDAYVVVEARPDTEEYGVTQDPVLFAGSGLVFADADEAIDAAARLLLAGSAPPWAQPSSSLSPDEIREQFPLAARSADADELREWALRPPLKADAA